jgi:hypothetical protein
LPPLPCGAALVAQVADGVPGDLAHQAGCPHCQAALALVARAVVARLLTRMLPGDRDRAQRQVKGAARGVMRFLIVAA